MEHKNIFEVDRKDYTSFLEQIKPECRYIDIIDLSKWSTATKVFSIKTNKCLCSRISYKERVEGQKPESEKYFIFEMPESDERREPIPKIQLHLETPEQVQAFFNIISEISKENKND